MKNFGIFILSGALLLSSCSYQQLDGVTKGTTVGAMFGSTIGGLMGGFRGHQIGALTGMTAGAAIGLAATTQSKKTDKYEEEEEYNYIDEYDNYEDSPIEYGQYKSNRSSRYQGIDNGGSSLQVEQIRFSDANNNRQLDADEHASIELDIYNRGNYTLYNVAPQLSCDTKRIQISPTAIIGEVAPNQGFRYRAELIANRNIKDGTALFSVSFGNGKDKRVVKKFRIRTAQ